MYLGPAFNSNATSKNWLAKSSFTLVGSYVSLTVSSLSLRLLPSVGVYYLSESELSDDEEDFYSLPPYYVSFLFPILSKRDFGAGLGLTLKDGCRFEFYLEFLAEFLTSFGSPPSIIPYTFKVWRAAIDLNIILGALLDTAGATFFSLSNKGSSVKNYSGAGETSSNDFGCPAVCCTSSLNLVLVYSAVPDFYIVNYIQFIRI